MEVVTTKKFGNANTLFASRLTGEYNIPITFDPSRMFEPLTSREISSEVLREYLRSRDQSSDPVIRERSHFEGHLTPYEFHRVNIRDIPEEDIAVMKRVGYRILEFGAFNWGVVVEALKIYKSQYGNLDVPLDYIITEEVIEANIGFTEEFEDLNLGDAVEALRIGDVDGLEDPERKATLDDLGFTWGDMKKYQRYRFAPLLLGLKIYRHLYGFPLPQSDFVVPDEPQWPYWMNNMPLGEWTAVLRIQQKMVEEYYPHRYDMLNSLEFLWWIPPGPVQDKYYQPLTLDVSV